MAPVRSEPPKMAQARTPAARAKPTMLFRFMRVHPFTKRPRRQAGARTERDAREQKLKKPLGREPFRGLPAVAADWPSPSRMGLADGERTPTKCQRGERRETSSIPSYASISPRVHKKQRTVPPVDLHSSFARLIFPRWLSLEPQLRRQRLSLTPKGAGTEEEDGSSSSLVREIYYYYNDLLPGAGW
jgi:hypothetical protein